VEFMDGARRAGGLSWVVAGAVFATGWAWAGGVVPGWITLTLVAGVVVLAGLVLAERLVPERALAVAGRVVAVLLAADFAGAVADRFGAFGAPGAPGVSWGSWTAFVDYTGVLLLDAPRPVAVVAAVAATAAETVLAVLLVSGWQRRWVGKGAAGLLTFYLVAMAVSVGWGEVARYALPLEIGGALLVTVCPPVRRPAPRSMTPPLAAGHP
jgi:hypothetical protein